MKKYHWFKFADSEDELEFSPCGVGIIEANGKAICIARHNNELFGFAYTCPHAGGLLANGSIDSTGNITCPNHRYKFSIKSGRNTSGEGFYLKTFPIEKRIEGLYIGIEQSGLFNL